MSGGIAIKEWREREREGRVDSVPHKHKPIHLSLLHSWSVVGNLFSLPRFDRSFLS